MYIGYKRNNKSIFFVSQFIIFIFCLCRFNYFNSKQPIVNNDNYKVIEKYNKYVILEKEDIKYVYYDSLLETGNEVLIDGDIKKLKLDSDFNNYLRTQNIEYYIDGKVIYNNEISTVSNQIIYKLLKDKDEYNKRILKLVLFNQKDDSNIEFYKLFETFSITFLLVISGFHINLLFKLLAKTKIIKYIIGILYLYLLNFAVSSFKAFLYLILKSINKRIDMPFNNCDLLSFIMIAFLFINPSYCFNMGFIYSFGFSFLLDILNNTITKKGFKYSFLKKIIIYMSSIPIMMFNNYEINSNSLLVNLAFSLPISLLFIFSFLYLFLDKFYVLYKVYIFLLEYFLNLCSSYSKTFIMGKPSYIVVIILYGIVLFIIYFYQNKLIKHLLMSISFYLVICFGQYCLPYLDSSESISFLDVGQGDCTIIKIKNSKKVIMIDTGGSLYRDIANDKIIPYLKKKGIDSIETLIISHGDYDHMGASIDLIEQFKVKNVMFNNGEYNELEKELINKLEAKNINYSSQLNQWIVSDIKLYFINNGGYTNENDNSIVILADIKGLKVLLMGDVSKEVERDLLSDNKISNIHILKVAHHGSSTSTSEEFIKTISPIYSIISVGKNNLYGHPNDDVIEILKNSIVYRTDIDGDVIFKVYNGKMQIETKNKR